MNRTLKIILSLFVIGGAGTLLIATSIGDAEYFKHVDQVLKEPERFENTMLKVHGFVEAGSIKEEIRNQTTERTFILQYEGQRIAVSHSGPKPDTFRDLSEVVARGTLVLVDGEYKLEAVELMAKCPSKYEENQRTRAAKTP